MILDMDNVKENNNYIWLGDWEAATQLFYDHLSIIFNILFIINILENWDHVIHCHIICFVILLMPL